MRLAARVCAVLVVPAVLAAALVGCGAPTPASPTHVAAVFFDGENHGNFWETCSVIEPSVRRHDWGSMEECASFFEYALGQAAFAYGIPHYKIVPHSYKGWREGKTKAASVAAVNTTSGVRLTVFLVKTRNGWRVRSVA